MVRQRPLVVVMVKGLIMWAIQILALLKLALQSPKSEQLCDSDPESYGFKIPERM